MNAAIKKEVRRLYDITPENVNGTAFGRKFVKGKPTPVQSVIFYVTEKKPLAEIPEHELLPSVVTIDGQEYVTDVVEHKKHSVRALTTPTCYNHSDQSDPEIARLNGYPHALLPMRGGQAIIMWPSFAAVGTLGFFAIDNEDGRVVGVTNTHVVMEPVFYAKDVVRPLATEILSIKNTLEPDFSPADDRKYPVGSVIQDGGDYHPAVLHVKRYVPLRSEDQAALEFDENKQINKIDAALLIMNNKTFGATNTPFVGPLSYGVRRPSDIETATPTPEYLPFATTAELDALPIGTLVYATGRTTGPKGYCADRQIEISAVAVTKDGIEYGANDDAVAFEDVFQISAKAGALDGTLPSAGGDSGSAVLADVVDEVTGQPTRKIIGLLFAGRGAAPGVAAAGYVCRIDTIASTLNIRAWDSPTAFNGGASFDPAVHLSVPVPRVVTRDLSGDNGKGNELTVTVEDNTGTHTYWHSGCTIQQYYSESGPTDITLSNALIYENNNIGKIIGQFSATDPDALRGVVDVYTFRLVPGTGSTDNASFTILANQLRAAVVFNKEVKDSYSILVRATDTVGRPTEKIFTISVGDLNDLVPSGVSGVAGNQQVTLSWSAPSLSGADVQISGYRVQYSSNAGTNWTEISGGLVTAPAPAPAPTQVVVTGLSNGTGYIFRVAGNFTPGGDGPWAPSSNTVTPRTIPDAPTSITGYVGNQFVYLSWLAPASNGGAAITNYIIQYSQYDEVNEDYSPWETFPHAPSPDQNIFVTGLTNNATYIFRVAAVNAAGTSSWSIASTVFVPQPVVTNVVAVTGDEEATVSWTAPATTAADDITDYIIQYSNDDGGSWSTFTEVAASTLTSAVVTGLTNGDSYIFRVAAAILGTTYAYSAPSNLVVIGAPTNIYLSIVSVTLPAASGTVIGELTAASPITSDSFIFTLIPGAGDTDNAEFDVDDSDPFTINLTTTSLTSVGTKSIRIRVTNDNGTYEKIFAISVIAAD